MSFYYNRFLLVLLVSACTYTPLNGFVTNSRSLFVPLVNCQWASPVVSNNVLVNRKGSSHLFLAKSSKDTKNQVTSSCEFELQELRAQTAAMIKQKVRSRSLTKEKQNEIISYIKKVVNNSPSPVPLKDIGANEGLRLMGSWRLAFSTEDASMGDLPREAQVVLKFMPYYKLDYSLEFSKKVWGLSKLTAKSTYTVDTTDYINPGLVSFVYDDIVTDVLGLQNLPVAFFGLLKGRTNSIESIWFDGNMWIDRGFTPQGNEYYNVYIKE